MPTLRSHMKAAQWDGSKANTLNLGQQTDLMSNGAENHQNWAAILSDTINKSQSIIESTEGASSESIFRLKQPAPLSNAGGQVFGFHPINTVQHECTSTWAISLLKAHPEYKGKIALVNCSLTSPLDDVLQKAVGQPAHSLTQEQVLNATSTLRTTLTCHHTESKDSWPSFSCPEPGPKSRDHKLITTPSIFSPAVTIFKTGLIDGFKDLPADRRANVAVISISAPRNVHEDNIDSIIELGHKIITIFRLAVMHRKTILIFDDFGSYAQASTGVSQQIDGSKRSRKKATNVKKTVTKIPYSHNDNKAKDVAELLLHIWKNDAEFSGCFEKIYIVPTNDEVGNIFRAVNTIDELGLNLEVVC